MIGDRGAQDPRSARGLGTNNSQQCAIGLGATRPSCHGWECLDNQECGGHATSLCRKIGDDV